MASTKPDKSYMVQKVFENVIFIVTESTVMMNNQNFDGRQGW